MIYLAYLPLSAGVGIEGELFSLAILSAIVSLGGVPDSLSLVSLFDFSVISFSSTSPVTDAGVVSLLIESRFGGTVVFGGVSDCFSLAAFILAILSAIVNLGGSVPSLLPVEGTLSLAAVSVFTFSLLDVLLSELSTADVVALLVPGDPTLSDVKEFPFIVDGGGDCTGVALPDAFNFAIFSATLIFGGSDS
jgi:hypothetical protein